MRMASFFLSALSVAGDFLRQVAIVDPPPIKTKTAMTCGPFCALLRFFLSIHPWLRVEEHTHFCHAVLAVGCVWNSNESFSMNMHTCIAHAFKGLY